jgi:hypothetical protein
MNTSPITKWDGATAYFTYADNPNMMLALLALSAVIVVGSIIFGAFHEKECYVKVEENGKR